MKQSQLSLMSKFIINITLMFGFFGLATSVAAHTYFFGVSDLRLNSKTEQIEVIHQFTAHDIENAIAQIKQTSFSPEHVNYEVFIQEYFENHFALQRDQQRIKLNWLGFEIKTGKLFAYQESDRQSYLEQLVVKNTILVDTYAKQVNTVNFQLNDSNGSLTFDKTKKLAKTMSLNEN